MRFPGPPLRNRATASALASIALTHMYLTGRPLNSHVPGEAMLVLFWNPGCGFCTQMAMTEGVGGGGQPQRGMH